MGSRHQRNPHSGQPRVRHFRLRQPQRSELYATCTTQPARLQRDDVRGFRICRNGATDFPRFGLSRDAERRGDGCDEAEDQEEESLCAGLHGSEGAGEIRKIYSIFYFPVPSCEYFSDMSSQAGKHPDNVLANGPQPNFTSRFADPNHPVNSGSLISLVTGGYINVPPLGGKGGGLGGGLGGGRGGGIGGGFGGLGGRGGFAGRGAGGLGGGLGSGRGGRGGRGGLVGAGPLGLLNVLGEAVRGGGRQPASGPAQDASRQDTQGRGAGRGLGMGMGASGPGSSPLGGGPVGGIKKILKKVRSMKHYPVLSTVKRIMLTDMLRFPAGSLPDDRQHADRRRDGRGSASYNSP
jgi:hypothetical protein